MTMPPSSWKSRVLNISSKLPLAYSKAPIAIPTNREHIQQYIHENTHNAFDLFNGGSLSGCITYTNPKNGDEVEVGYQYSFSRSCTSFPAPIIRRRPLPIRV